MKAQPPKKSLIFSNRHGHALVTAKKRGENNSTRDFFTWVTKNAELSVGVQHVNYSTARETSFSVKILGWLLRLECNALIISHTEKKRRNNKVLHKSIIAIWNLGYTISVSLFIFPSHTSRALNLSVVGLQCWRKKEGSGKEECVTSAQKVGQQTFDTLTHFYSPNSSSAPPANGFSQMARMMDSLILDSLSSTPYAYTKITTHRPMKKATSSNHLPTNGLNSSTSSTTARNTFHNSKKIPTQGESN